MEETAGILVPISLFAMIALMVIVPRYFRSQERQKMADTVRLAIEKGQPLPPEVIGALTETDREIFRPQSPARDLRRGLILIGVGLGMAAAGMIGAGVGHMNTGLIGASAIPGFIGLAFMVMYFIEKPKA